MMTDKKSTRELKSELLTSEISIFQNDDYRYKAYRLQILTKTALKITSIVASMIPAVSALMKVIEVWV